MLQAFVLLLSPVGLLKRYLITVDHSSCTLCTWCLVNPVRQGFCWLSAGICRRKNTILICYLTSALLLFIFFQSTERKRLWDNYQHVVASNRGNVVLDGLQDLQTSILHFSLVLIPTRQREVEVKFVSQELFYSSLRQKAVCRG